MEKQVSAWVQRFGQTVLQRFGIHLDATTRCFERARDVQSHGGPWSFLVFETNPTQPDILRMSIATLDDEFLEAGLKLIATGSGYLELSKQEAAGLMALLESQAALLFEGHPCVEPVFHHLDDADYAYFRLHPEWLPDSNQHYYRQINSHVEANSSDIITLLLFSTSRSDPNANLFFAIKRFPQHALQDPDFTPLDDSQSFIDLNQVEIRALVEVFGEYIE
jgi:hypothetical protein